MADAPPTPKSPEGPRSKPFNWVGLVVIVVLVAGGILLVNKLYDDSKLQDCVQTGRRNCAPIDTANLKK